jgi:hypothetical protein
LKKSATKNKKIASEPKVRRGRPSKTWIEKIRILVWYKTVRNRSDLTDYALDTRFNLFPDPAEHKPFMGKSSGQDRLRVFENIRKYVRDPTKVKIGQQVVDLVRLVDSDPEFSGTQDIYLAPIWDFLLARPNYVDTNILVDRFLRAHSLARLTHEQAEQLQYEINASDRLALDVLYLKCLRICLAGKSVLDRLFAIGLLYRQSHICSAHGTARTLSEWFDEECQKFCFQHFDTPKEIFGYYGEMLRDVVSPPTNAASPIPGSKPYIAYPIIPSGTWEDPNRRARFIERLVKPHFHLVRVHFD